MSVNITLQTPNGLPSAEVCAAGLVTLEVDCHQCARRGRYGIARMLTRIVASSLVRQAGNSDLCRIGNT